MLDIRNIPSGQTYQLIGNINDTDATPTITLKGDAPTLDIGAALPAELVLHITLSINENGESNSEAFYVDTPVDNGNGTYTYQTVVRALKNNVKNNPPVAGDSKGATHYKQHVTGAKIVIDPTVTLRYLYQVFLDNVEQYAPQLWLFDYETEVTVGDNRGFFIIPEKYNGTTLKRLYAKVLQAGSGGTTDITIKKNGVSAETISMAGATEEVVANTAVATNDTLSVEITSEKTTADKGLIIIFEFET